MSVNVSYCLSFVQPCCHQRTVFSYYDPYTRTKCVSFKFIKAYCCCKQVAMTMPPPSNERQQVVIPAQGMIDIRDTLTDILSEFGASYSHGKM